MYRSKTCYRLTEHGRMTSVGMIVCLFSTDYITKVLEPFVQMAMLNQLDLALTEEDRRFLLEL